MNLSQHDQEVKDTTRCPRCTADPGELCIGQRRTEAYGEGYWQTYVHQERVAAHGASLRGEAYASSNCPVCGVDVPHGHSDGELGYVDVRMPAWFLTKIVEHGEVSPTGIRFQRLLHFLRAARVDRRCRQSAASRPGEPSDSNDPRTFDMETTLLVAAEWIDDVAKLHAGEGGYPALTARLRELASEQSRVGASRPGEGPCHCDKCTSDDAKECIKARTFGSSDGCTCECHGRPVVEEPPERWACDGEFGQKMSMPTGVCYCGRPRAEHPAEAPSKETP